MKQGRLYRTFVYYLCVSLLLLMGGFPQLIAEAKDMSRPIGEMVSRGDVKYQAGGNTWKNVEASHLPLFPGVKIKTENGACIVALASNSQVEVGQNSILSVDEPDRLHLTQGSASFRIPAAVETTIKVGNLSIVKSRALQASRNSIVASGKDEGIVGAVTLHASGSVTVKSDQGALSIVNQERTVVASVSSKESVTIPSAAASGKEPVTVAQAGAGAGGAAGGGEELTVLGLSGMGLLGAGIAAGALVGLGVWAFTTDSDSGECP